MAQAHERAVEWRDGVHVAGTVLWCDARRARDLCFLSHALKPARGAHGKLLTTARTAALLAAPSPSELLVTPFSRPFSLGAARIELFPSGRLPGAAQLAVQIGGRRVVYAGDLNPHPGLGEPMEVRGAEVLVLEAPLASPDLPIDRPLPPREQALSALVDEARRAVDQGATPVFIAPSLGVAQEAARALAAGGITVRAHPQIAAYADALRGLGIALPPLARFAGSAAAGEAVLWPLERWSAARVPKPLARLAGARTIALTGRALADGAAERLGVDRAIALADHADARALVDYAAHAEAREVYFTAGGGEAIARALMARGVRVVEPLGPPRQLSLW